MTFKEYYASGPHAEFASHVSDLGAAPFTVFDVFHPRGDYPDPPMPEFALFAITKGTAQSHFGYGGRRTTARCMPGTLGLAPPNVFAEYTVDGPLGYVGLAFPASSVDHFFDGDGAQYLASLHKGTFRNDALASLLPVISQEAATGHLSADIVADSIFVTILSLLAAAARSPAKPLRGALLSSRQQRILTEYVNDNLSHAIRLSELADLIDMSQAHLVRACKASFGMTPHRFVVSRRVDKACAAIRDTDEPLAKIAVAVGFSSQSHMSDTIRRHMGMTPQKLRRYRF